MQTLQIPLVTSFNCIPTGEDGLWEWIATVLHKQPAEIKVAKNQPDLRELAAAFHQIARALGTAAEFEPERTPADRFELAKMVRDALMDPVEKAAHVGRAQQCKGCGILWAWEPKNEEELPTALACPECNVIGDSKEAGAAAEDILGIEGPFTRAKVAAAGAIEDWF